MATARSSALVVRSPSEHRSAGQAYATPDHDINLATHTWVLRFCRSAPELKALGFGTESNFPQIQGGSQIPQKLIRDC